MLKGLKGWYGRLSRGGRILVMAAGALALAPALVMVMKVLLGLGIVALMLLGTTREERIGPEHYPYMYAVVEDWNRNASPTADERESLLGFGEYMNNSHLLLFPRQAPGSLREFYFAWESMGFDVDGFAAYFTCEMTEENYAAFVRGLADFTVATDAGTLRPIFDAEHFQHPAYILQWMDVGGKWEVLEYIMLDEAKHTAVFVYSTIGMHDDVETHSAYTTTPSAWDVLSGQTFHAAEELPFVYQPEDGFTIYAGFDTAQYDLSFLEYLN